MAARYLGVDSGRKRIGLALGDREGSIVSPLKVLEALPGAKENARAIVKVAQEYAVAGIVIGLPLNMDGTQGPQAKLSKSLADAIRELIESAAGHRDAPPGALETSEPPRCEVYLHDERLTSHAADHRLATRGLTQKKRRARQDAVAAQILLESFFKSHLPNEA